jgi:hypothetical protein
MTVLTNSNGHPISGTTTQRTAITSWEPGEQFFDTTLGQMLTFVTGTTWVTSDGVSGDYGAAGLHSLRVAKMLYDFTVDGAGSGGHPRTITPASSPTIPIGAIILSGMMEVLIAPTGATNLSVLVQGAGDVIADAAISGAPWSTTGLKDIVPVATAATAIKVATTAKQPRVVSTVAALTAGKFAVHLLYVMGN